MKIKWFLGENTDRKVRRDGWSQCIVKQPEAGTSN